MDSDCYPSLISKCTFTSVIVIHCSNKLQALLGHKSVKSAAVPLIPIGNWNAHVFLLNRQKHLIFINAESYYAVIVEQVKKDSLKNIGAIFADRLIEQLIADKVMDASDGLILLHRLHPIVTVSTNNNRKAIGTMNDFISMYMDNVQGTYWQGLSLVERNSILNDMPVGAGKNASRQYGFPKQDMVEIIRGLIT